MLNPLLSDRIKLERCLELMSAALAHNHSNHLGDSTILTRDLVTVTCISIPPQSEAPRIDSPPTISLNQAGFQSPTLVTFGGRDLQSEDSATSFSRFITETFGTSTINNFAAYYSGAILKSDQFTETLSDYYRRGAQSDMHTGAQQVARSFINQYLLPKDLAVSNETDREARTSKINDLKASFSNITLFGFSFGSFVLNAFDRELALELVSRGFSSTEAADIRKHLAIVTIADFACTNNSIRSEQHEWAIPALHVASTNDDYVAPTLSDLSLYPQHTGIRMLNLSHRGSPENDDGTIVLERVAIIAPLTKDFWRLRRKEVHTFNDPTGHLPIIYLTPKAPAGERANTAGDVLIPVIIRDVVLRMLDKSKRPCDLTNLLMQVGQDIGLQQYASQRVTLLIQQIAEN